MRLYSLFATRLPTRHSPPRRAKHMPATALNSAIFRDIFSTAEMRGVFSDETRTGYYLEIERGAGARAGAARHHSREGRARDRREGPHREHRSRPTQAADRAHRLSDPGRGAADRRPVRRRARRMVPLGRHHPGHHRHRRDHADPRGARPGREGHGGDRRRARRSVAALPRHADGRPQQSAAGGAAHLRLQDAPRCSPPCSAIASGWRSCVHACWSASSAARSARWLRSAPTASRCRRR